MAWQRVEVEVVGVGGDGPWSWWRRGDVVTRLGWLLVVLDIVALLNKLKK